MLRAVLPFFFQTMIRHFLTLLLLLSVPGYVSLAHAGIQYTLDRPHAVPGETITIQAVLFNDTDSVLDWAPPKTLVLQWRGSDSEGLRSVATLAAGNGNVRVPVNNFVTFAWTTVVPATATGLQAINVEGTPTLLALDTSPLEASPVAGTPVAAPVFVAQSGSGELTPADPDAVAAAGVVPDVGSAPAQVASRPASLSTFETFRNTLSAHDPMYFLLGDKGGLNARFQLSFKFRPFSPSSPGDTRFINHWYIGYTQTSLWDLSSDSYPFIDTTYNPSIFWQKDALLQTADKRWRLGLTTGVEHQSNGKDGEDSRSINDVFVQPEFSYRLDGGSTLTFAPRVKAYFSPDETTPDYRKYTGNVQWKLRWAQDDGLVLSGMYQRGERNRYTTQIDAAWPLRRTFLNMNGYLHVQYFQGYGMTMMDYRNKTSPQVRVGLSLVP